MRKIGLGWIALTLSWALAYADDPLNQTIDYDQPAQTLKQLLADLSRQTTITLFAKSPLDTEIVLVAVHKMPLKTLMEHLATITDAEWVKQPNGSYHLIRSPKLARERREQDNAQILASLQRALKRKELEPLFEPLTEEQVRKSCEQIKSLMQQIESQEIPDPWDHPLIRSLEEQVERLDAGRRLLLRLVRQLDLRRLLEIPVGERRVFSNVRGRYLEPLGFEVRALVEQYQREARLVHQVWTHPLDGFDKERVEQFNERYRYVIGYDYEWRREPLQAPLTRLYLEVTRDSPDWFSFGITLVSEDLKQGVEIPSLWDLWFQEEESEGKNQGVDSKPPQLEASQKSAVRVEWSALSRQFIEAYRAVERAEAPIAFPEVLDPAKVEPLGLVPTDVLRTYARQRGKSLVALVPDSLAWWLTSAVHGRDVLQLYEQSFRRNMELREREEVLLFKPRWSSYRWGQRVDRRALSRWMHQLRQRGYPKLEDYLTLLQIYERSGLEGRVFRVYQHLILPRDYIIVEYQDSRLLNRLSAKQLDYLRAGGRLTPRELSPEQREQLLRDIYFGHSSLEQAFSASDKPTSPFDEREQEMTDVRLPHVFYPDGLPGDLTIQVNRIYPHLFEPYESPTDITDYRYAEEIGVFTRRRAGVWHGFQSVKSLALDIYTSENPSGAASDEEYVRYIQDRVNHYKMTSLMPARRKPFRLEVRLGSQHVVYLPSGYFAYLYDFELLNEGKPVTLDKLPDELRSELEKRLEQLKTRNSPVAEDGD